MDMKHWQIATCAKRIGNSSQISSFIEMEAGQGIEITSINKFKQRELKCWKLNGELGQHNHVVNWR